MNKKYVFLGILLVAIGVGIGIYLFNSNKNNSENSNYESSRISQNVDNTNIQVENSITDTPNVQNPVAEKPTIETEIASFTTKIYTKDSERQNNISIACNTLNDTIVENGKTFSFSNTVGKATSGKGYQKADVYQDGEVVEALGGGMCQVSSTLYNAVLKVSDINVTERHSHSNSVPYVKSGKDAAVAYGSYDFKFVNNSRKFFKN